MVDRTDVCGGTCQKIQSILKPVLLNLTNLVSLSVTHLPSKSSDFMPMMTMTMMESITLSLAYVVNYLYTFTVQRDFE